MTGLLPHIVAEIILCLYWLHHHLHQFFLAQATATTGSLYGLEIGRLLTLSFLGDTGWYLDATDSFSGVQI